MDFLYDESGSAYSFIYNGTQYYYVKNLQGDVVKILNASGSVVANYYYDAWGKVNTSAVLDRLTPSDIEVIITIPKQASTICRADIMIRRSRDLSIK